MFSHSHEGAIEQRSPTRRQLSRRGGRPGPARFELAVTACLIVAMIFAGCGANEESGSSSGTEFATQAGHIHGLGVNPKDDALFIATHSGLFRSPSGSSAAERVGSSTQDIMGFSVAGPDNFFGSGHPEPGTQGPPNLGLIESRDAGGSWQEVSLLGEADFHVLRYSGGRVYGYNGLSGQLMISADRGISWQSSNVPEPLFDLAINPRQPNHLIASTGTGVIGRTTNNDWTRLGDQIGLLAWPDDGPLYLVEGDGKVSVSSDGGRSWKSRGRLPEAPVALTSSSADDIYVALESGTIVNSNDGGRTWTTRVSP